MLREFKVDRQTMAGVADHVVRCYVVHGSVSAGAVLVISGFRGRTMSHQGLYCNRNREQTENHLGGWGGSRHVSMLSLIHI